MTHSCLVCNEVITGSLAKFAVDVFKYKTSPNESFASLLSGILDTPITEDEAPSTLICVPCKKAGMEYNSLSKRLKEIKSDLKLKFNITLDAHNTNVETTKQGSPDKVGITEKKSGGKTIVLSASKLQPLPANYFIDVSKLALSNATLNTTLSKVSPATSPNKLTTIKQTPFKINNQRNEVHLLKTSASDAHIEIDVDIPKGFMENVDGNAAKEEGAVNNDDDDDVDEENNEELPMEIDEECTLIQMASDTKMEDPLYDKDDSIDKAEYFDVSLISDDNGVVRRLRVISEGEGEADDDDEDTYMLSGAGSVLRVVRGTTADGQDSNDESQIELQVSGDEETANAIIAAAQETGGAFIKVETGEMFQVQSIHSTRGAPGRTDGRDHNDDGIQTMVERQGEEFKCLICERSPKDPESVPYVAAASPMMTHLSSEHSARLYLCEVCQKVIRTKRAYTMHMEEHATKLNKSTLSKGKYECQQCLKKYASRMLLEEHMHTHSGARPHSCAVCGKTFASKYTKQAHMNTHLDRPRSFKCRSCDKGFHTQYGLNKHEVTHLGNRDFVCKMCGKAFSSQHNLELHHIVHSGERPFACDVCPKAFARRAELRDHARTHTGERPFSCDVCGASFAQRSNLHSHRRVTHMNDLRHACPTCPKRFKRRRLLDYHIKSVHTGERPLSCPVCVATFVYPEHYRKHLKIHTGEKPYKCEVCGKTFNSRDNRNTHRFVHSDKKPYECLSCGVSYMRKSLLYTHMNTSGHLAESIVVNQPRVQNVAEHDDANRDPPILAANQEIAKDANLPTEEASDAEFEVTETTSETDTDTKIYFTNDKKLILQDGGGTINLIHDGDGSTLLNILQNLDGVKPGITAGQLSEQIQLATGDDGMGMRLVQIMLDNGDTGWVAVNPD